MTRNLSSRRNSLGVHRRMNALRAPRLIMFPILIPRDVYFQIFVSLALGARRLCDLSILKENNLFSATQQLSLKCEFHIFFIVRLDTCMIGRISKSALFLTWSKCLNYSYFSPGYFISMITLPESDDPLKAVKEFNLPAEPPLPSVSGKATVAVKRRPRTLIIAICVAASLAITILGSFIYYMCCKNRATNNVGALRNEEPLNIVNTMHCMIDEMQESENADLPTIPLSTIRLATDDFSPKYKLGEGGFGPVYKGILVDGKHIAVKRLSKASGQGLEEFKNEVILIAKLQHRNLVRLLGCCVENDEKLLVYEYMQNGSLDVHLFDATKRAQLDWKIRICIIHGIARGVLYLHEDSRLRVIHRDLKASNILLDQEMHPKISDFGLARSFGEQQKQANTMRVVGTYGYMAPEYAMEGLFSVKSDVFSFGVLLLEIISGKRNGGFYLTQYGQSLLVYAWTLWCGGRGLELMDPLLETSCVTSEVLKCIHIGLLCVQEDRAYRPTMSTVVTMLASETVTLPEPKQPAFSAGRAETEHVSSSSNGSQNVSMNQLTTSSVVPR